MRVSAIAAMSKNRVIGRDNGLPWDIPEDMKFFRDKTRGHPCIMGRKTWLSMDGKPLPGRANFVISRNDGFEAPGAHVFTSVQDCLTHIAENDIAGKDEVFIIGGQQIYELAMPVTQRIYLTEIEAEYKGDTFFPDFSLGDFKEVERQRRSEPESFAFVVYDRVKG